MVDGLKNFLRRTPLTIVTDHSVFIRLLTGEPKSLLKSPICRSGYTLLMRKRAALSFATLLLGTAVLIRAQAPAPESAYIVRGKQAEAHQHELKERLDR